MPLHVLNFTCVTLAKAKTLLQTLHSDYDAIMLCLVGYNISLRMERNLGHKHKQHDCSLCVGAEFNFLCQQFRSLMG